MIMGNDLEHPLKARRPHSPTVNVTVKDCGARLFGAT